MGAAALPAAIGLQMGGSIYSAFGARNAGRAQEGYYNYVAHQSDLNANLAEMAGQKQAHSIQDSAAAEYARYGRQSKELKGAQRAAAGAAGISGSVTAEDIARDTENKERLDEMAIRFNADTQADDVLHQAGLTAFNLRSEAEGYRAAGSEARAAGNRAFVSSLIGGATSVSSTLASGWMGPTEQKTQTTRLTSGAAPSYLPSRLSLQPTQRPYQFMQTLTPPKFRRY